MTHIWKPTRADLAAAQGKTVPDVIAADLAVLFVGINPGLYSAAVAHHFARPGNRFWPALHQAEFTDRQLSPFEDGALPKYGLGITNLVERATARADELTGEEFIAGAGRLAEKVQQHRVRCVAFLGVTAYRTAFHRPQAVVGPQAETLGNAAVRVLPNPSGLNAHYRLADFVRLFSELRQAVARE